MTGVELIPIEEGAQRSGERVNVFIHGYRSMVSPADIESAVMRVRRTGVVGENYLLRWMAGRWRDSATVAGLRAAYKATRFRYALAPWSLLVDAGVIGVHEAAQFKLMERRAEAVGRYLPNLVAGAALGRPVNFIGHSLGARVAHHALGRADESDLRINDVVLLAGAADRDAVDWEQCVRRLHGRLYNAYSRRDRVLQITPDMRRRVGAGPMAPVVVDGEPKVVNIACEAVGHMQHWMRLAELLPTLWPACTGPAD